MILFIVLVLPATAVVLRNGGTITIPSGQTINDDLVISGGTVRMLGNITGDLVVMGGNVEVDGSIGGSLMAMGGTVILRGPVTNSLYAAAGTLDARSTVGRNMVVTGGTVTAGNEARVGRDLAVAGGTVTVGSNVQRNLRAAAGTLTVTETARIGGDLIAQASTPTIEPGAVIAGERIITQPERRERRERGPWAALGWFLWPIFTALALIPLGLAFIAAASRLTEDTQVLLRRHPWASLLAGFITLIIVPFIVVLLMVTVIGIPLALVLMWLYLSALLISPIFAAILIGRLVWRRPAGNLFLAFLIGLGIITLARFIPLLGSLVTLAVLVFGLGSLVLAIQGRTARPLYPTETTTANTTTGNLQVDTGEGKVE